MHAMKFPISLHCSNLYTLLTGPRIHLYIESTKHPIQNSNRQNTNFICSARLAHPQDCLVTTSYVVVAYPPNSAIDMPSIFFAPETTVDWSLQASTATVDGLSRPASALTTVTWRPVPPTRLFASGTSPPRARSTSSRFTRIRFVVVVVVFVYA